MKTKPYFFVVIIFILLASNLYTMYEYVSIARKKNILKSNLFDMQSKADANYWLAHELAYYLKVFGDEINSKKMDNSINEYIKLHKETAINEYDLPSIRTEPRQFKSDGTIEGCNSQLRFKFINNRLNGVELPKYNPNTIAVYP